MVSMGESTRRRLGGLIASAQQGGGGGTAAKGAAYHGGYQGGLGGTWGKARTGRGLDLQPKPTAPLAAGPPPEPSRSGGGGREALSQLPGNFSANNRSSGRRDRVRPNSAGVKSAWELLEPKAPPKGISRRGPPRPGTAPRPRARDRPPLGSVVEPAEYGMGPDGLQNTRPRSAGQLPGSSAGREAGAGAASSPSKWAPPASRGTPRPGSVPEDDTLDISKLFGRTGSLRQRSSLDRSLLGAGATGEFSLGSSQALQEPAVSAADAAEIDETQALQALQAGEVGSVAMVTGAQLLELEEEIRRALREQRTVYESERELLLRVFRDVDDGSGDVDVEEFCRIWAQMGLQVRRVEVQALYRKYGFSRTMPYQKFAYFLLTPPNHQLANDAPMRKGALRMEEPGNFKGKIIYPPSRKPVYTPSDWDASLARRSAQLPLARLHLSFVYGYNGHDNADQNLFYCSASRVVYYTAGIAVVYDKDAHSQHFFLGHDDDIKGMAICAAAVEMHGRTYPSRTICATGQVTAQDHGPYVCVWDNRVRSQQGSPELVRLQFDKSARGIVALGFSPCGLMLVTVAMDNPHTVTVWDWRNKAVLGEGRGFSGEPPQVYGVEWDAWAPPAEPRFVTYGRKHLKMWSRTASGGADAAKRQWVSATLSFGRLPLQNANSAVFLPSQQLLAGMASGEIYIFRETTAVRAVQAHRPGPHITLSDGSITYHGLRGLKLRADGCTLLSAGADGVVRQWDVSEGRLRADAESRPIQLHSPYGAAEKPPAARALDCHPEHDDFILGTASCDVWEVSESEQETLMYGHSADLCALAWHPVRSDQFASAAESSRVFVWNAGTQQLAAQAVVGFPARSIAWSTQPMRGGRWHHLAVGGVKGSLRVLDEEALKPVWETKDALQAVNDLKYSPDGRTLAAATSDTFIDLYSTRDYSRIGRCVGHSSSVRHVDWSLDSSILQSNCSAYEILYWNATNGKQVARNQRDTAWASWTCILGFPVMGIWPEYADGTDINAVDRSPDEKWVFTADDSGLVKLFNHPCVVEDAPHRAYRGHSSHVMSVRCNSDGTVVCSAGGRDRAIFQFDLREIEPEVEPEREPELQWGPIEDGSKTMAWTRPALPKNAPDLSVRAAIVEADEDDLPGQELGCQAADDDTGTAQVFEDGGIRRRDDDTGGWGEDDLP